MVERQQIAANALAALAALLRILPDHVRGLFADHVDRAHDEESGNAWEDGGVPHAQALCSVHPEAAVQDAILVARADGAAARRVVTPGMAAHKLAQIAV